uniref:Pyrrolo-quinoline quinone repeat domain-containing protein n=1 Tax=Thermosporothrix sp. COM3 TaxID=2490863 RepID=A0A455SKS7_9CHLR|nr:hypothetical protein KTC_23100 [Thermosporothrix sp. COM3]
MKQHMRQRISLLMLIFILLSGVISCASPERKSTLMSTNQTKTLYIAAGTKVYCVRETDGSFCWTHDFKEPVDQIYATSQNVFVQTTAPALYALASKDGLLQWRHPLTDLLPSQLFVQGDLVFIGAYPTGFMALTAHNGAPRWQTSVPITSNSIGFIGSEGDSIYGYSDGTIYALRADDGHIQWKKEQPYTLGEDLLLMNGNLLIPDINGEKVIELRASTGAVGATFPGNQVVSSQDFLFLSRTASQKRQTSQELYALHRSDQQELWKKTLNANEQIRFRKGMLGERYLYVVRIDRNMKTVLQAVDLKTGDNAWTWTPPSERPDIDPFSVYYSNEHLYISTHNSSVPYPENEKSLLQALDSQGGVRWKQALNERILRVVLPV